MRWFVAKPKRDSVQRAKSRKRTRLATASRSATDNPLQYAAPISAPTLVPATALNLNTFFFQDLSERQCARSREQTRRRARVQFSVGLLVTAKMDQQRDLARA